MIQANDNNKELKTGLRFILDNANTKFWNGQVSHRTWYGEDRDNIKVWSGKEKSRSSIWKNGKNVSVKPQAFNLLLTPNQVQQVINCFNNPSGLPANLDSATSAMIKEVQYKVANSFMATLQDLLDLTESNAKKAEARKNAIIKYETKIKNKAIKAAEMEKKIAQKQKDKEQKAIDMKKAQEEKALRLKEAKIQKAKKKKLAALKKKQAQTAKTKAKQDLKAKLIKQLGVGSDKEKLISKIVKL